MRFARLAPFALLAALVAAAPARALSAPAAAHPPSTIVDQGRAPVLAASAVYLVFWGRWAADDPVAAAVQTLTREIPGSKWTAALAEYGVKSISYGGTWFDASPPGVVDSSALEREAGAAAGHFGLQCCLRTAQFVVLPDPSADLSRYAAANECGEHDYVSPGYAVSVVAPFSQPAFSNCASVYNGGRGPDVVAATAALTSHEIAETATDPVPGDSWSASGQVFEVGDACYPYSTTPADMTVNVSYLWSAQRGDCEAPDPAAAPQPQPQPQPRHHPYRHHHRHRRPHAH